MKGADFGGWDPSSAASYSRDRLSPLSTPRLPHLSRGITILVGLGFDLSLQKLMDSASDTKDFTAPGPAGNKSISVWDGVAAAPQAAEEP